MEAKPPGYTKPDTSRGFDPRLHPGGHQIAAAQRVLRLDGSLDRFHVHPEWVAALRRRAYVANAQASSSIEGNPLTLEEAEDVVHRLETAGVRKPEVPEREIIQHYRYFQELDAAPEDARLTVREIEETHSRLLNGVLAPAQRTGKIRGPGNRTGVYVGRLKCTPWQRVKAELDALHAWYYGDGAALPVPIRVAVWFHEFESIHPFRDGNGRVGRALAHRLLRTDGLPNSLLVALDKPFNDDRRAYYAALESVQERDSFAVWVDHFLAALESAYESSLEILTRLVDIPASIRGAPRAILEYAYRTGVTTLRVRDLVKALGDYKPITVTWALSALADEGWLEHNGLKGKASAYGPGPRLTDALDP